MAILNDLVGFSLTVTTRYNEFSEFPTGVEPMTFQNTCWTTELWETGGKQGHVLCSYICVTRVLPYCKAPHVEMINVNK